MIRRLAMGVAVMLACMIAASPASARHHKKHHRNHIVEHSWSHDFNDYLAERIQPHPAGCPHTLFCACGVSMKIWGYAKHMAAAAFFRYPRTDPAPGMVAVRQHHVMYIERYDGNGNATVYDPNSGGHKTRIHERSLAGYRIVNPHT